MVLNCCVPFCTTKTYKIKGEKISHYQFPSDKLVKQKWIHAIRRDVGPHFTINDRHTKVCSRHFKPTDFYKTLAGIRKLKEGAVPSIFHWKQESPKRKSPKERHLASPKRHSLINVNTQETVSTCTHDVQEPACKNREIGCQTDITQCELIKRFENALYCTDERPKLLENTNELQEQIAALSAELQQKEKDCVALSKKLDCTIERLKESEKKNKRIFTVDKFLDSDDSIIFYTGVQSVKVFESVFKFLNPGEKGENIRYKPSSSMDTNDTLNDNATCNGAKPGKPRSLKPKEELFITLCRLRQGFAEEHISNLYGIHQSTVSRIVISWLSFIFLKCSKICIWPSREQVDKHMPESFKEKYPSTKIIIDCTEIKCQMPSSLLLNSQLYSSYKNHTTLKGLIGITPGGSICFISELYTGRISDREIVERSGFLEQSFEVGDSIMADKGFLIQDLLPPGVHLNIPPFLGDQVQFSANDTMETQSIASLRVHVERAINKIKNFHIWDRVIPINLFGSVNQMWSVCAFLCNLQNPIISA